jgi:hypothetical protein
VVSEYSGDCPPEKSDIYIAFFTYHYEYMNCEKFGVARLYFDKKQYKWLAVPNGGVVLAYRPLPELPKI